MGQIEDCGGVERNKMKTTKLTSKEAQEIMPTAFDTVTESGLEVMGAIQTDVIGDFPEDREIDREARAKFGAVRLANCEPDEDGDTYTWLVVRA
jgi:hypothetical protein